MSLPIGSIIMWQNEIEEAPSGWSICDGNNGTPDLRGKFILGATIDDDVNMSQVQQTHVHSRPAATSTDGSHQHGISVELGGSSGSVDVRNVGASGANAAGNGHGHSGISGNTSGETGAHSHTLGGNTNTQTIIPPYIKLFYIMRTS